MRSVGSLDNRDASRTSESFVASMSALPLKIVFSEPSIDILRLFQSFPSNKIVSLTRYVPSESFNDISPLPCSFSAKFIAAFSVAKGFFDEPSAVLSSPRGLTFTVVPPKTCAQKIKHTKIKGKSLMHLA